MNNYLPINKFYMRNNEYGDTKVYSEFPHIKMKEFEKFCYIHAEHSENAYCTTIGISRKLYGRELNELLKGSFDSLSYSYYDKEMKTRFVFEAYSIVSYTNLRYNHLYQVEVDMSNNQFMIYRVDKLN